MKETRKLLNEDQMLRVENYGKMGGIIKDAYHCKANGTEMECIKIYYYNMDHSAVWDKNSIDVILNGIKLERNKA